LPVMNASILNASTCLLAPAIVNPSS
jgi:hypothetical protein